jgi:hypothetical protein
MGRCHHRFLVARTNNFRAFEYSSSSSLESCQKSRSRPFLTSSSPHGLPLRSQASSSSSSSAGGVGENVGCSDTLTDLRRTVPLAPAPVPVPGVATLAEIVDELTSDSSFPGTTNVGDAGAAGGSDSSSSVSRTVRNDATDPLSLPSSSVGLIRSRERGGGGGSTTTMTRGGADGITIGFGGVGGGVWLRSALRNGRGGGGGKSVDRCGGSDFAEGDDGANFCGSGGAAEAAAVRTLPGASTVSNAIPRPVSPRTLYSATEGGARTLTKPPVVPVPRVGSVGKPAFARSHAVRFCRVTPSTIAMSDNCPDPARPASVCEGRSGAVACESELLFAWCESVFARPMPKPGADCDGGKLEARSPALRLLGTGGALPELRNELCRDTSVVEERASASIRRSVFLVSFARVGVDNASAGASEEVADAADGEGVWADVGMGGRSGGGSLAGVVARLLSEPFRAPRPPTAAPSLIHPP